MDPALKGNTEQPNEAYDQWADMQESETQSEHEKTNPEELRDSGKMIEQLNQMGVKPEIVSNPVFEGIIKDIILDSGFKKANIYSIEKTDSERATEKRTDLAFIGDKEKDLYGSGAFYDAGEIKLSVDTDGDLNVRFAGLKKDGEELINSASETTFSIIEDGSLRTKTCKTYESEMRDNYFRGYHEDIRTFDSDGVESTREIIDYPTVNYSDNGILSRFAKFDRSGKPTSPIFEGLFQGKRSDAKKYSTLHYILSRNKDGETMHVWGNKIDENGHRQKIEVKSVAIDTEHGPSKLNSDDNWESLVSAAERESE